MVPVCEVVPGSRVVLAWGATGVVRHVIVSYPSNPSAVPLVTISPTLRLTPYHPVVIDSEWRLPSKVAKPRLHDLSSRARTGALFSLVVEDVPGSPAPGFMCGLHEVAALAHGLAVDPSNILHNTFWGVTVGHFLEALGQPIVRFADDPTFCYPMESYRVVRDPSGAPLCIVANVQ